MPPLDPSPLGDEMVRRMPERKFPQPKPGGGSATDVQDEADIAHRPALPEHPEPMAADLEDEETDPFLDRGAGIADGKRSPSTQKG